MHTRQMKNLRDYIVRAAIAMIVGAVAIVGLTSCSSATGAKPDNPKSVCFVAEKTGYLTKTIAADFSTNLKAQAKKHGLSYKEVNTIKQATNGQCATVITYGDAIANDGLKAAKANPNINFVIDHAIANASDPKKVLESEEITDNVKPYTLGIDQAATIAGYLGAGVTQSGYVGVIAVDKSAAQSARGFSQGVDSYNKAHGTAVEVRDDANGTADLAKIEDTLKALNEAKVDVIMVVAGEEKKTTSELKESAKPLADALAKNEEYKPSIFWVGEDGKTNYPDVKELTINSINIDTKPLAKALIKATSTQPFDTKPYYGDLRNGVIKIDDFQSFEAWISDQLKQELSDLSSELTDGAFVLGKPKKEESDKKADSDKAEKDKSGKDKSAEKSDEKSDDKSDNKSDDKSAESSDKKSEDEQADKN